MESRSGAGAGRHGASIGGIRVSHVHIKERGRGGANVGSADHDHGVADGEYGWSVRAKLARRLEDVLDKVDQTLWVIGKKSRCDGRPSFRYECHVFIPYSMGRFSLHSVAFDIAAHGSIVPDS